MLSHPEEFSRKVRSLEDEAAELRARIEAYNDWAYYTELGRPIPHYAKYLSQPKPYEYGSTLPVYHYQNLDNLVVDGGKVVTTGNGIKFTDTGSTLVYPRNLQPGRNWVVDLELSWDRAEWSQTDIILWSGDRARTAGFSIIAFRDDHVRPINPFTFDVNGKPVNFRRSEHQLYYVMHSMHNGSVPADPGYASVGRLAGSLEYVSNAATTSHRLRIWMDGNAFVVARYHADTWVKKVAIDWNTGRISPYDSGVLVTYSSPNEEDYNYSELLPGVPAILGTSRSGSTFSNMQVSPFSVGHLDGIAWSPVIDLASDQIHVSRSPGTEQKVVVPDDPTAWTLGQLAKSTRVTSEGTTQPKTSSVRTILRAKQFQPRSQLLGLYGNTNVAYDFDPWDPSLPKTTGLPPAQWDLGTNDISKLRIIGDNILENDMVYLFAGGVGQTFLAAQLRSVSSIVGSVVTLADPAGVEVGHRLQLASGFYTVDEVDGSAITVDGEPTGSWAVLHPDTLHYYWGYDSSNDGTASHLRDAIMRSPLNKYLQISLSGAELSLTSTSSYRIHGHLPHSGGVHAEWGAWKIAAADVLTSRNVGEDSFQIISRRDLDIIEFNKLTSVKFTHIPTPNARKTGSRAGIVFQLLDGDYAVAGVELLQKDTPIHTWTGSAWAESGNSLQWVARPFVYSTKAVPTPETLGDASPGYDSWVGDTLSLHDMNRDSDGDVPNTYTYTSMCGGGAPAIFNLIAQTRVYGDKTQVTLSLSNNGSANSTIMARLPFIISSKVGYAVDFLAATEAEVEFVGFNSLEQIDTYYYTPAPLLQPENATFRPGYCGISYSPMGSSDDDKVEVSTHLIPGQGKIGFDTAVPNPSLGFSFTALPTAGQWIEVSCGHHKFYYQVVASDGNTHSFQFKLPTPSNWLLDVNAITASLRNVMQNDANLLSVAMVNGYSIESREGNRAQIRVIANDPGPNNSIGVKLLETDRETEAAYILEIVNRPYVSGRTVIEGSLQIKAHRATIQPSDLVISPGEVRIEEKALQAYFKQGLYL